MQQLLFRSRHRMQQLHSRCSAPAYASPVLFALSLLALPALAQDAGAGTEIFNATCAHCHGGNAQGGVPLVPWYLQQMRLAHERGGQRLQALVLQHAQL
jgi:mono/diheme cytochrome c family protein